MRQTVAPFSLRPGGWHFMDTWFQDIHFAFRVLCKHPGFTMVSVIALALGIGANSTIYSSLQAMVLRPLAFRDLDRILTVSETLPRMGADGISVAPANYRDLAENNSVFERVAALQGRGWDANVTGAGVPDQLEGYLVTPSFFPLLDMSPLLGRTFNESEAEAGDVREAVISFGAWQRHFGGDRSIIGRDIVLNGSKVTVIGVMPREFDFPIGAEIWAPLPTNSAGMSSRTDHTLDVIGRLKAEASLENARAELNRIAANLEQQYPVTNSGRGFRVGALRKEVLGETRNYILILMWSAAFVLVLACANVANLQLARALGQQRELAVRTALGASRWRIARQVLAESCMLSMAGGMLGLLLAMWAIPITRAGVPAFIVQHIAGVKNIRLDSGVIVFTAAVALLTGILAGLIPALQACSARDLTEALKEGTRGSSLGAAGSRSRSLLVISEVALALILLVGASLMVKGFRNLINRYPGYEASTALSMRVTLPEKKYATPRVRAEFYERAAEKLAAIPGVEAAAAVRFLPSGWAWQTGTFSIENATQDPEKQPRAGTEAVTPDFFPVLKIPLRAGRFLSHDDGVDAQPVAIISGATARRYWPGGDPVGHRIRLSSGDPWRTIVGIVGDIRQNTFDDAFRATIYVPIAQVPPQSAGFILRTPGDPMASATAARVAIQSVDADQPVFDIRTLEQLITDNASGVQYAAHMMSSFALIALLLAAAGIYAVMAYAVVQCTREIGVRMALGAQRGHVLRMIVGRSVKLAAVGLFFGVPIAFLMMRALAGLLVGVIRLDIPMLAGLTLMLGMVAALAGYIPARRATQIDPITALRDG
jgi:putative ABC transport system permease protein